MREYQNLYRDSHPGAPEYLEPTLLGDAVYLVADAVVAPKYTRHSGLPWSDGAARCLFYEDNISTERQSSFHFAHAFSHERERERGGEK